jgi:hypothetical protein
VLRGLAAASVVFLLSEIARAVVVHVGASGSSASFSRLVSVLAAIVVLALWIGVALARATLSAPNRLGLARLADRRLQLDERLSTALEISGAAPRHALDALLGAALARDAHGRIRALDPGAMASPWLSRWVLLIPVAIVLGLSVPAGSAVLAPGSVTDAGAAPQPGDAAKADSALPVQVTQLANTDATRQQSSLPGGAAPKTSVSDAETSGGTPGSHDVTQVQGQFASHTNGIDDQTLNSPQASKAAQALPTQVLSLQSPSARPEVVDHTRLPQQDAPSPSPASQPKQPQQQQRPPQPDVNNPEQSPAALKDAPAAHAGNGYDEAFSTFQQPQPSSTNAQLTLTEQQQIEAAENAYSSGVQAGDGTRPLGNGGSDAQLGDLLSHDAGQLSLPQAIGTEGERITVKAAPPTGTGPVAPYTAGPVPDTWTGAPDQAVDRHQIHPWERDILARYFRPDSDGQ